VTHLATHDTEVLEILTSSDVNAMGQYILQHRNNKSLFILLVVNW